jgi:FkbM family methyltransferase
MKEFVALHNLNPIGVVHVGAHKAEEIDEYLSCGFGLRNPIIWVEAQENLAKQLAINLDLKQNKIYHAVAWNKKDDELFFHITSKSASSSLFELGEHKKVYPDIEIELTTSVKTSRLDEVLHPDDKFDFVVLDIQGAELQALEGMGQRLNQVNWIFTEISKRELYKGATQFRDLEQFLKNKGFKRVFTAWDRKAGWGDALYVRNERYHTTRGQDILINFSRLRRYGRSFIPQSLFPFLVDVKRLINNLRRLKR